MIIMKMKMIMNKMKMIKWNNNVNNNEMIMKYNNVK